MRYQVIADKGAIAIEELELNYEESALHNIRQFVELAPYKFEQLWNQLAGEDIEEESKDRIDYQNGQTELWKEEFGERELEMIKEDE